MLGSIVSFVMMYSTVLNWDKVICLACSSVLSCPTGQSGSGATTQQVAGGYRGQDSGSFGGRTAGYSGQDSTNYGGQSTYGGSGAATSTAQQTTGHFPPSSYGTH